MMIFSAFPADLANDLNGYLDKKMRSKEQRPGEFEFFVIEAKKSGGPVLELASGACRMMMILASAGIETFGVEASSAMIAIGRKAVVCLPEDIQKRIHVVQGDMRSFVFSKKFPLIIIPYNSFWFNFRNNAFRAWRPGQENVGVQPVKEQAEECIGSIMQALAPQGRFIVDAPLLPLAIKSEDRITKQWWDAMAGKHGFCYKIVKPYVMPKERKYSFDLNAFDLNVLPTGTEVLIGERLEE